MIDAADLDDLLMLIKIDAVLGRKGALRRRLKDALEQAYKRGLSRAVKAPAPRSITS
jgi:hypothetical protein